MALFEVPGWQVPDPTHAIAPSKKKPHGKQRRLSDEGGNMDEARANIEKLLQQLGTSASDRQEVFSQTPIDFQGSLKEIEDTPLSVAVGDVGERPKQKKRKRPEKPDGVSGGQPDGMVKEGSAGNPQKKKAKKQGNADQTVGDQHGQPTTDQAIQLNGEAGPSTSPKKKKKKAKDAQGPVVEGTTPGNGQADDAGYTVDQNAGDDDVADNQGLSELQQKMKKRLKGAQFRFINETLYTSESTTALNMIKEDPKMFEEYHKGFRSQCKSWPVNPVSHYITALSSYPKTKIIADLGCGDGALARTLSPQGFSVLSYDLLSDGVYITEADICTKLPLPGKDVDNSAERIGQVVDICVCSLSLMSVNWVGCIREARRVLKDGGELKIAEVTSRFVDVDAFIALIARIGFKLVYKGAGNTHFMLFEFRKISRNPISEEEWTSLMEKGSMLKPCEYKRR